jgi:Aromatic-ring-opening dioxygenase LigAB, LigA subunit
VYALQKLLWDVRKNPALAERFRAYPTMVLDEYQIDGYERAAMAALDLKALYDRGANPYLLYFCALQIGIDRAEYYGRIRGEII